MNVWRHELEILVNLLFLSSDLSSLHATDFALRDYINIGPYYINMDLYSSQCTISASREMTLITGQDVAQVSSEVLNYKPPYNFLHLDG